MKNLLLLFAFLIAAVAHAQKMDEIAKTPEEKFYKSWHGLANYRIAPNKFTKGKEDGTGYWPYMTHLQGVPKRIGLVTFYVYDNGTINTSTVDVYKTFITPQSGNKISNSLLAEALEPIKTKFAQYGMQVLTPAEFLDTPEKQQAYQNFKPDFSGFTKAMNAGGNAGLGEAAAADGYKYWYLMDGADWKISNGFGGELCKSLGLDAVMVWFNDIGTDGQYFSLGKTYMMVYGPNPTPKRDDIKYVSPKYQEGMLYQGATFDVNRLFYQVHPKKGILYEEYKGYDKIAGLMSEMVAYYISERVKDGLGDWKKKK